MADKPDYRGTVFLPRTDFPMKAGLPQTEPQRLAQWQASDLYGQLRAARAGAERFILHDGPPYANGDIHIGHALNHVLKDMVCRTQSLLGRDAPYVPGWDCHGLPIEWKVEEEYRKAKLDKDAVPPAEFRSRCRAYAAKWVDTQREQLKRLGVLGDWDNPYLTMDFAAEATIVQELLRFAESGQLYRGAKPVMWSPVEKTALAEAEVEYEDITSTQVDVAFEIVEAPNAPAVTEQVQHGAVYAAIWTTTPWTIPVNQALAFNADREYCLIHFEGQLVRVGNPGIESVEQFDHPLLDRPFLIATTLADAFAERYDRFIRQFISTPQDGRNLVIDRVIRAPIPGTQLTNAVARHPMHHLGGFFARPRPFLPGDFVTTDQGTGLVHMAPDHGEDDFALCGEHGLGPVFAVEPDGRYRADWPWLGGEGSVINPKFNAPDGPICTALREAGALLSASQDYRHSYPHSWRSKAKLIYRATPQWFFAMDRPLAPAAAAAPLHPPAAPGGPPPQAQLGEELGPLDPPQPPAGEGDRSSEASGGGVAQRTLRGTALAAIDQTRFVPERGRNRLRSMVEQRPDWVISRQRAWGVPITLFVDRRTGDYLRDPDVNARIVDAVREHGVDAWTADAAARLLGPERDPADYEQVTDILDVWFDSGCTHAFVLDSGRWPDLRWPADLYLEGSDQHRGWFQSSLLESCGTRGRAPYQAVLTHGFTMASDGRKMSKSLGNTVSPNDLMKTHGADILRLWALSVDFTEDHRIGKEILDGVADQYRKLRNTLRYLLGALDGWSEDERVPPADMPELERWVLHRLAELDVELRRAVADFDFTAYVTALQTFATNDLSAFYFDIRKDSLYCDAPTSPKRRACRTVLDTLFHALTRWLAPVLVFTAEEAWTTRSPGAGSVHLLTWPEVDAAWVSADLNRRWNWVRDLRAEAYSVIEPLRRSKEIGSSLEAEVVLNVGSEGVVSDVSSTDLTEVCIVANASARFGRTGEEFARAVVRPTIHAKCARCWRHRPEVGAMLDPNLCDRCYDVVGDTVLKAAA